MTKKSSAFESEERLQLFLVSAQGLTEAEWARKMIESPECQSLIAAIFESDTSTLDSEDM